MNHQFEENCKVIFPRCQGKKVIIPKIKTEIRLLFYGLRYDLFHITCYLEKPDFYHKLMPKLYNRVCIFFEEISNPIYQSFYEKGFLFPKL
jgi:hypothetical protein